MKRPERDVYVAETAAAFLASGRAATTAEATTKARMSYAARFGLRSNAVVLKAKARSRKIGREAAARRQALLIKYREALRAESPGTPTTKEWKP